MECGGVSMPEKARQPPGQPALTPLPRDADDLLRRWLAVPAVVAWWGNRAVAEARLRLAAESRAAIRCLVLLDGEPIGYAQALDSAGAGGPVNARLDPGIWECDLFVGSERHRGQGLGTAALDLLVTEVFATTLATGCAIFVPVASERVARACEGIGFRWTGVTRDPATGMVWVMVRNRPQA